MINSLKKLKFNWNLPQNNWTFQCLFIEVFLVLEPPYRRPNFLLVNFVHRGFRAPMEGYQAWGFRPWTFRYWGESGMGAFGTNPNHINQKNTGNREKKEINLFPLFWKPEQKFLGKWFTSALLILKREPWNIFFQKNSLTLIWTKTGKKKVESS